MYLQLVKLGVKEPEIVLKQSILETGWYKCCYCSLSKNNIFGLKKNKSYLSFKDWTESIAYYKQWQDKYYKGENYYTFLKRIGYATSEAYEKKLKTIRLDFEIKDKQETTYLLTQILDSFKNISQNS